MLRQKGFTLLEMMIVVAIIGILGAIAYPSYQSYVIKAGRSDGQAWLMRIMQAQERFNSQNQTYTANLGAGGLALGGAADAALISEDQRYSITAAACANTTIATCVMLSAAPRGAQARDAECGTLTLNSRGTKGEGGTAASFQDCW